MIYHDQSHPRSGDSYMYAEMLLPEFDQEMSSTRKLLECFPDGKADWRPHEKSMTLGRLAGHVAELPGFAHKTMAVETLEFDPPGSEPTKPFIATSREQLLKAFDENVVLGRQAIANAKDEDMGTIWTLIYQGRKVFAMPRAAVMRTMVMNHLIHHRAQLGVYLRMNDIAIPGVYGPSADDKNRAGQNPPARSGDWRCEASAGQTRPLISDSRHKLGSRFSRVYSGFAPLHWC